MASRLMFFVLMLSLLMPLPASAAARRIITLYPGHTDNVIALGGESLLVGISKNDDAKILPKVPRFTAKSGPEAILALKPDLVLTRDLIERQNPQLRSVLERAGVKVVSIEAPDWDEFPAYLRKIAELIGSDPKAAEDKLKKIRSDIAAAAEKASHGKKPSVFVEATSKELYTCSPDSWAARLIALAGGKNAAPDAKPRRSGSAVAPYGLERILRSAAEGKIDIYLIQNGTMNGADLSALEARSWYPALNNVKKAVIPERELSRPSLLGREAGGRKLIKIFYGE